MIIEDRLIPECVMENWFMFQLHMFFKFSAFNEFDQNSDFTVFLDWYEKECQKINGVHSSVIFYAHKLFGLIFFWKIVSNRR